MTPQDETIFHKGQNQTQDATAVLNKESTNQSRTSRWQTVTIGGAAGIAMGLAASQAYGALTADDDAVELVEDGQEETTTDTVTDVTVTEVHQAKVDQNLSFADAFTAARAEVGPGGVFLWHGQLYNTYTADEWHEMNDAQKDEFAEGVQPFLGQQTVQTSRVTTQTQRTHIEEVSTEPEVHFLGVETRDVNGHAINLGHMTVDNVNVTLVDVDNDQVFDFHVVDVNNNQRIDERDYFSDISRNGFTVRNFQLLTEMEQARSTAEQLEQTDHIQEDLAPDMPDYMNDADVDII